MTSDGNDGINSELVLSGVSASELVSQFGTPLLVIEEQVIRQNCKKYNDTLNKYFDLFQVFYASKAFLNIALCRIIEQEGLGLDVVSGGELYQALVAGFPAEKITFHGNNKSRREIIQAVQAGIGAIAIDNLEELETVDTVGRSMRKKVPIKLRIVPSLEATTHPHLQTGKGSKFGLKVENGQAQKALDLIEEKYNVDLIGLHCHMGSQLTETDVYLKAATEILKLAQQNKHLWKRDKLCVNLGGGFGISHNDEEKEFPFEDFVKELADLFADNPYQKDLPPLEIQIEPGRSIIGPAGTTLYTMGYPKEVPDLGVVVPVDGGMSDNIRPALYDAKYRGFLANAHSERKQQKVSITGRLCESGDMLINDIYLPTPQAGDILAIPQTGAYSYVMSSNYNGLTRPTVVLVNDGKASIMVRGETYNDLIAHQEIPTHLQNEDDMYKAL